MTNSLRQKATSGVFWSAFERFGQQGCAFIVQLVLARLLVPEIFGLIAIVSVFVSILNVVADCGFSRALIQRKEIDTRDLDTVFFFNVGISLALYLLLYVVAPLLSNFYNQADLVSITRWLGLSIVFGAFGSVQTALLNREMLFKKLFKVTLPATLVSGGIGVGCAYFGLGVWALVVQVLVQRVASAASLWVVSSWRPSFYFSLQRL
ncbi:oligosaccharide flippase family protein, partial [Akkermansiaceae bacterium]|nr:oligosaccharide flippase family protein [Akkermansiaceae bacterium]